MRVCFVCTGNICRSPMAELVFGEHLRRAGLDSRVEVSSCGTGPWHIGEPADPRAAKILVEHGYPSEHSAAQIDEEHASADLLVGMDAGHLRVVQDLLQEAGAAPERARLLRSFDPRAADGAEVPDPFGGRDRGFDETLDLIEAAVPGLLQWVREQLDSGDTEPTVTTA